MGRQVMFFATAIDYLYLYELISSKNCIILDEAGNKQSNDYFLNNEKLLDNWIPPHYIATEKSKFVLYESQTINPLFSEVIELSYCYLSASCSPKNTDFNSNLDFANGITNNSYQYGRIWYESSYYDSKGILRKKSEEIEQIYSFLARSIRKKSKKANNDSFYIMPDAYKLYKENKYFPCCQNFDIDFD